VDYLSATEAVKVIKSGDRVFLHGGAATPTILIQAMQNRHSELRNVELVSITNMGEVDFNNETYKSSFYINAFLGLLK